MNSGNVTQTWDRKKLHKFIVYYWKLCLTQFNDTVLIMHLKDKLCRTAHKKRYCSHLYRLIKISRGLDVSCRTISSDFCAFLMLIDKTLFSDRNTSADREKGSKFKAGLIPEHSFNACFHS